MNHQDMFDLLVEERGIYCERCNWNKITELHHCIVHRMKNHPELNQLWNYEGLCRDCHSDGYVNSYEHRVGFWNRQKERGYPMKEIYDSLPLKKKENFE